MDKGEKEPLLPSTTVVTAYSNGMDRDTEKGGPPPAAKAAPVVMSMAVAVGYYALCSSTMLIINKVTIHALPAPTFVLFCQLLSSTAAVQGGNAVGWLEADRLEWAKMKTFIWVVVGFLGTVFANMKVLQHANVETFITFRSSTPLVLSLCDYFFLGRAWPNLRSWLCLVVLLAASAGYVMVDAGFKIDAYIWLALWYVFYTFDTAYVKHCCDTLKMTNWGRVYYTNFVATILLIPVLPLLQEHSIIASTVWTVQNISPLLLSCVVGVCMCHSAYILRDYVSATMYTIVGIVCKLCTVVINWCMWDKHASLEGVGFLLLCILAGTLYQQAPKRR